MNIIVAAFLNILMELVNYALAYKTIFRAKFTEKKLNIFISFVLVAIIACCASKIRGISQVSEVVMLGGLIVPLIWFTKPKRRWLALYPIVVMYVTVIMIALSYVVAYLTNMNETEVLNYGIVTVSCELVTILIQIIVYMLLKRRETYRDDVEMVISKGQYIIFYLSSICSFYIVGATQILSSSMDLSLKQRNWLALSVITVSMVLIVLGIWHSIISQNENRYKYQLGMYELYMQQQEEQIQTIINSDQRLRSYRHDMAAHIEVMRSYCENGENEELKKYFNNLLEKSSLCKTYSYTGNTAVDAIFNNLMRDAEEKGINVTYQAQLPKELSISVFDLCTVLSNLFRNAIEACERSTEKREIGVKVYPNDNHLYIAVNNSVEADVEIKDNKLTTTKEDKRNHGFGSRNIESVIEKYKGTIHYSCDNKEFVSEIYI